MIEIEKPERKTSSPTKAGIAQVTPAKFGYPRAAIALFIAFTFYLAVPVIDIPLMGLSLSAPIFFLIAIPCLINPPEPWFNKYSQWIFLAALTWFGIFIAAMVNGLLSGGVDFSRNGLITLLRYAYWLLVFVITAYFTDHESLLPRVVKTLGLGILLLAILRLGEMVRFGNVGAWAGTVLLPQNTYGVLFSTFSPFFLVFILQARGVRALIASMATLLIWIAVALNGSRGSWVSIALGTAIGLIILIISNPKKFIGFLFGITVLGSFFSIVFLSFPQISAPIIERYDTFQHLDTEKSYMIRELMNQKSISLFKSSPLIGVGAARFTEESANLEIPFVLSYGTQEYFNRKSAHNSYLSFLAENGLAGAIPFGILLLTLLLRGLPSCVKLIRRGEYWALAITLAFFQMSIHMWVISSLTNTGNWFIYGLVAAMIMNNQKIG